MEATVRRTKRRKTIELSPATLDSLSGIASGRGITVKRLIEKSLEEMAEDHDDAVTFEYLRRTRPEGFEMASEEETQEFKEVVTKCDRFASLKYSSVMPHADREATPTCRIHGIRHITSQ